MKTHDVLLDIGILFILTALHRFVPWKETDRGMVLPSRDITTELRHKTANFRPCEIFFFSTLKRIKQDSVDGLSLLFLWWFLAGAHPYPFSLFGRDCTTNIPQVLCSQNPKSSFPGGCDVHSSMSLDYSLGCRVQPLLLRWFGTGQGRLTCGAIANACRSLNTQYSLF